MTKTTISNLAPEQNVQAGYVRHGIDNRCESKFLNFFLTGPELYFATLKDVKNYFGVSNLTELENAADASDTSVYCRFHDVDGNFTWAAYLWKGAFRVGSSADRLAFAN